MFKDTLKDLIDVLCGPISVVAIIFALMISAIGFLNITFFDNVPVKCWVDNKLIYEGKSAGIDVKSSGSTTVVKVLGGYLYLFPKKYYVSNNVKLEGIKGE